ncbi:hypothetical protein GXW82_43745 [Streptacidiphilus sp. 4-A2]|nr:hypothetical protein [Streptacidiphilus sp. 4-A2]
MPPVSAAGTVPREARSALREQAEREVARRILEGEDISTEDQAVLANRYGKRATWVGDRMRSARRRLATDSDFELAVIASALEDQAPVSQETRDTEPAEVDEQHETRMIPRAIGLFQRLRSAQQPALEPDQRALLAPSVAPRSPCPAPSWTEPVRGSAEAARPTASPAPPSPIRPDQRPGKYLLPPKPAVYGK